MNAQENVIQSDWDVMKHIYQLVPLEEKHKRVLNFKIEKMINFMVYF